jgi:HrpA-like RNA helicase
MEVNTRSYRFSITYTFYTIARDTLVREILENDCTIIVGETGSGKTTRKFIKEKK